MKVDNDMNLDGIFAVTGTGVNDDVALCQVERVQ